MRTSVIDVHDMLSALSVDDVEKQIAMCARGRKRNRESRGGKRHESIRPILPDFSEEISAG